MIRILLCTAAMAAPAVAYSQTSVPIAAPRSDVAYLRIGTEVPLRTVEELTTKEKVLKVGQRFRLEVSESVLVNGTVVIPAGSPAMGEITDVRNKGMWGKSGKLNARLLYVTVNGRQIRLSGAFDDKGVAGGTGAVAVSAIVFAPAGFFMTGTSARVAINTPVKGFVDEDVPLAMAVSTPLPLTVPAPGAAPVTVAGTPTTSIPAAAQPTKVNVMVDPSLEIRAK
jgi:hypothetical protein